MLFGVISILDAVKSNKLSDETTVAVTKYTSMNFSAIMIWRLAGPIANDIVPFFSSSLADRSYALSEHTLSRSPVGSGLDGHTSRTRRRYETRGSIIHIILLLLNNNVFGIDVITVTITILLLLRFPHLRANLYSTYLPTNIAAAVAYLIASAPAEVKAFA